VATITTSVFTIVELLQNTGIQQIIPPVKTIHGQPTQRIDDFTLIVYPFIDAQNGFNRALTDEQWLTLGKALRQIHEIDVPSSIQHRVRREAYSPKWRGMILSWHPRNATSCLWVEVSVMFEITRAKKKFSIKVMEKLRLIGQF
jgi:hypothetical protein